MCHFGGSVLVVEMLFTHVLLRLPLQVHGIVVQIYVQRHTAYYLVSMVVPIMVCYALICFGEDYTANNFVTILYPFKHVIRSLNCHLSMTCQQSCHLHVS